MAILSDDVKRHIVQALACYDTPSQVAEAVKTEFGVEIARQHVAMYDPTKVAGAKLAKRWRDLFEATRKEFLEEQAKVPIAAQNYRLRALDRMFRRAENSGNTPLAVQILEQAAKEQGGAFTNTRKLADADGSKLPPASVTFNNATTVQAPQDAYLAMLGKK